MHIPQTAVTPTSISEVQDQIDSLTSAATRLEDGLQILARRLEVVRLAQPPTGSGMTACPPDGPLSPVGAQIRDVKKSIVRAEELIEDIVRNLAV